MQITCIILIISEVIGVLSYQVWSYMPKSFEDLLKFQIEDIVKIHYEYGKEEAVVIDDKQIIKEVVQYLDSFTYYLKKESSISQDNLEANSYRLEGPFFVGKKDNKTNMNFYGYEMSSWLDYYYIEGGIVEEDKLLQLLQGK